jgi:hypothetical protein
MRLVAGFSPRRLGFAPMAILVGFMVDVVALGQVSLRVLRFSAVSIIPLYTALTHVSSGGWTLAPLTAAVLYRHNLTPSQH